FFFFSSRRRHTRFSRDWSSDVCSSDLKKKEVFLNEFEKPVFLRTYASWLVPTEGEVPALNELAKEYNNEIQIVVLFWDKHETTRSEERRVGKECSTREAQYN